MALKIYLKNTFQTAVSALELEWLITNPKDFGFISSSSFLTAHIEDYRYSYIICKVLQSDLPPRDEIRTRDWQSRGRGH